MSEPGTHRSPRALRRLILLAALVVLSVLVIKQVSGQFLSGYGAWGSDDFIQYWSAGRLAWSGDNPYDAASMLRIQKRVGLPYDEPKRTWNPPWMLPLDLLIGALPFDLAVPLWLLVDLGLLLASGLLLWRYYAPGDKRYWIGLILVPLYVPGLVALRVGQISPWLLAGIVGFLVLERAGRDGLAGACLALLLIKPHFTYLFWLVALWWAWRNHRRKVILGWIAALAAASLLATAIAPRVWTQYAQVSISPPLYWASTTLGAWLRYLFGVDRSWLQFLPTVLGGIGVAVWLWRRRGAWHWQQMASPLLLASAITALYGWTYDQVVLLPVVVDLVSRSRSAPHSQQVVVLGALFLIELALWLQLRLQPDVFFNVWHPWALAVLYGCAVALWPQPPLFRLGENLAQGI
jgi:hypothetical protein